MCGLCWCKVLPFALFPRVMNFNNEVDFRGFWRQLDQNLCVILVFFSVCLSSRYLNLEVPCLNILSHTIVSSFHFWVFWECHLIFSYRLVYSIMMTLSFHNALKYDTFSMLCCPVTSSFNMRYLLHISSSKWNSVNANCKAFIKKHYFGDFNERNGQTNEWCLNVQKSLKLKIFLNDWHYSKIEYHRMQKKRALNVYKHLWATCTVHRIIRNQTALDFKMKALYLMVSLNQLQ